MPLPPEKKQLVRYPNDALATATNLLNQNRDKLDRVAQELMNREKLDKDEFVTIMEGGSLSPLDGMPSANPIEDLLKAWSKRRTGTCQPQSGSHVPFV